MATDLDCLLRRVGGLLAQAGCTAPDAELLERYARHHDDGAFAAIVARHGPMVLAACRRALRDAGQAEDAAQATFLVLARQAGTIRRPDALAAWLYQTARRLAVKHARAEARRRRQESPGRLPVAIARGPDPLDELSVRELQGIFDEEVDRLPERYRVPLILCCLQGCTLDEAAGRLGWPPGSVKGRLERGRSLLRGRLARRGITLPAALLVLEVGRGAVSAEFVAATVHAAARFASGVGAGAARGAAAIAEEGLRSTTMLKTKLFSVLLAIGVVTAGLAAVTSRGARPSEEGRKPEKAADQPAEKAKPRLDRHGDALPEGAIARLGTLRWRAAPEVHQIAFSPKGEIVATASRQGLCLFDKDGKLVRHIAPKGTGFDRLAFSPDGKQLACRAVLSGDKGGRTVAQIYDLPAGRKAKEIDAEGLHWLGWNTDGKPVGAIRVKGAILFRDLSTGKDRRLEVADLSQSSTGLPSLAYARQAKLLVVPDTKGIVHVWDTATGGKRFELNPKAGFSTSVEVSSDGRWLATRNWNAEKEGVKIWEAASRKHVRSVAADQKGLIGAAFSRDGKLLATIGWHEVRLWDVKTGRARARLKDGQAFAEAVAFAPDGKRLATVERHGGCAIQLWDTTTGAAKVAAVGHTYGPRQVAFSPDGRRVVSGGSTEGTLIVWDVTTAEEKLRVRRKEWLVDCALSPDGRSLYSGWDGDAVVCSDAATGRERFTLKIDDPDRPNTKHVVENIRLSADGKTLTAFSRGYPKGDRRAGHGAKLLVTGFDLATRKARFQRRVDAPDTLFAVSHDGTLLAFPHDKGGHFTERSSGDGPVRVVSPATGERLLIPDVKRQTRPIAFSPDGRLLATNTFDVLPPKAGERFGEVRNTLRLWELESAGELLALPSILRAKVAFTPDGAVMALTAPSDELQLWDLRRGKELRRFRGLGGEVTSLELSPDGRRLVSGVENATLLVWDVAGLKQEKPPRLGARALAKAWADLAGAPKKAFAARGALAGSPTESVALLKERLKPVKAADPAEVKRLVADLDSDTYAVREKARKALEALGDRAAGALRQALKGKPPLEVHKQIEALLKRRRPTADAETLRSLRAVAALEDAGTAECRKLLQALAGGAAGARLTEEAKAALERLGRRPAKP